MASFLLFINSDLDNQSSYSAYRFAMAATKKHNVKAVFFYGPGVHVANELSTPAGDEFKLTQAWQALAKQNQVELIVCSAAAQRKGILDQAEAEYHGKQSYNLANGFRIGGLAEYAQLQSQVDRVVQF